MSDSLRSLSEIIGNGFKDLEKRSNEAAELADRIRLTLRGPEKHHVLSAGVRGEELIVVMDSAAWCPQVRYQHEQIRTALHGVEYQKLRVRVGAVGL